MVDADVLADDRELNYSAMVAIRAVHISHVGL